MAEAGEVQLHFLDYWRVIKVRFGIILLAFLLVVITAGVTIYFLPRQYFSRVLIEVKPDDTRNIQVFESNGIRPSDSRFAPTQFQILQSKEILYPVIDRLGLVEKWSPEGQRLPKEQVFFKLLKRMKLDEVRLTDLISIGVYSTDPNESAAIANTIADTYMERREADQRNILDRGMSQLDDELDKQRRKVEQTQDEVMRLRKEQGIIDPNPESIDFAAQIETGTAQQTESDVSEMRATIATLESQLQQIDKLKPTEIMVGLRMLDIQDETIEKILPQFNEAIAQEQYLLNSGLGSNHPKVKALRAQREVYDQQLADQISALRKNLETRLKISRQTLSGLESLAEDARDEQIRSKGFSPAYLRAKREYLQAKEILQSAEMRLQTERMKWGIGLIPAKVWEQAEPSSSPAKPNVPAYMALAVLSGLIVGVGLAFFIEYLDTSVKTVDDVESFLGVSVLGVIRKNVGILHQQSGDSPDAEAYRTIRSNIEFNRKNPEANTISVVSGGPGEGKSTTLSNLAFVCAQGGYRVLIIDADLRRPTQHKIFGFDNSIGLTNHLIGELSLEDAIRPTSVENLFLIPSGILPTDAVGILSSQRMSDLIARVKGSFDLVFFDSPPILGVSDASVLAKEVDMTLMIVQHRRFPRSMLLRVKQAVLNVGGNLLGVVLNNVDTKHDETYQYYTSYYDYYSAPDTKSDREPARTSGRARAGEEEY